MRNKFDDFIYKFKYMFKRNPVLFILIALILIRSIMSAGSIFTWLYAKVLILPGILIGITVHEWAHAFASYKLGDFTPKAQGRISFDPRAHLDPWGFFFFIFSGFGWGKPVEINSNYYKNRRTGEIIVSLSGVASNFVVAAIFAVIYTIMANNMTQTSFDGVLGIVLMLIYYTAYVNVILLVFNLLPFPPLDGWNFISSLFNLQKYNWWYEVNNRAMIILMFVIILNIPDYAIAYFGGTIMKLLLSL